MMAFLTSFGVFLLFLLSHCYVMFRYEELMSNAEILDAVFGKPARAIGRALNTAACWCLGFLWGPCELLLSPEPGVSGEPEINDPFYYGRAAFQMVACVSTCLGTALSFIVAGGCAIKFLWSCLW